MRRKSNYMIALFVTLFAFGVPIEESVCNAALPSWPVYSIDFRGISFDNNSLRLFGSGTSQFVLPTKEGLAISAPKDKQVNELGFGPKFALRGDFEITAGFEIMKLDAPDAGYGVGPSLHIATNSPAADAATMSRFKRVKEGDVFSTHSATNVAQPDGKSKRNHSVKMFDTAAMTGRLRLVRAGKTLRYLVSEGGPEGASVNSSNWSSPTRT